MNVTFSARGTGACPLCRKMDRCPLRKRFAASLSNHEAGKGDDFEIVVYVCPYFVEQA